MSFSTISSAGSGSVGIANAKKGGGGCHRK